MDPRGHEVVSPNAYVTALVLARPAIMLNLAVLCAAIASTVGVAAAPAGALIALPAAGNAFAKCSLLVFGTITVSALVCAMDRACYEQAQEWADMIRAQGSLGSYADTLTWDQLFDWARQWPLIPLAPVVAKLDELTHVTDITTLFSEEAELPRVSDLKPIPKAWENENGDLIHELKKGYPKGSDLMYYPKTKEIYVVPKDAGSGVEPQPTGVKVD